jgi:hypothetical protein
MIKNYTAIVITIKEYHINNITAIVVDTYNNLKTIVFNNGMLLTRIVDPILF